MPENKNHFGLRFGLDTADAESTTLAKTNPNKHEIDFARRPHVPPQIPLAAEE